MKYIDVVVTAHDSKSQDGDDDRFSIVWPSVVQEALEKAGFTVRSVIVVDAASGLAGSLRLDAVQHKINKELGK